METIERERLSPRERRLLLDKIMEKLVEQRGGEGGDLLCKECGLPFPPSKTRKKLFCNKTCRRRYWRKDRA